MLKKLLLVSFVLISNGCQTVQIPNTTKCSVSGVLAAGMDCAESVTGKITQLTLDETITFLEPQVSPPRAGAICQSAEDANKEKTSLEQACRLLGKKCTYEMKQTIKNMTKLLAEKSYPVERIE